MNSPGPIVAFDFDGTLTVRDTFLAFLRWRAGPVGYVIGAARILPDLAVFMVSRDPERLKAAAVRVFLKDATLADLDEAARKFAAEASHDLLRPDALKTWRQHKADGARVVIVTASPELVIAPFAHGLGAEMLIGTRLAVDPQGRLTGDFQGRNCRGPEKVTRLREAFGEDVRLAAAYGDTDGDREMLGLADQGFMRLFVGRPARSSAA